MAASHTVVLYEPTETSPEVTTAAGFPGWLLRALYEAAEDYRSDVTAVRQELSHLGSLPDRVEISTHGPLKLDGAHLDGSSATEGTWVGHVIRGAVYLALEDQALNQSDRDLFNLAEKGRTGGFNGQPHRTFAGMLRDTFAPPTRGCQVTISMSHPPTMIEGVQTMRDERLGRWTAAARDPSRASVAAPLSCSRTEDERVRKCSSRSTSTGRTSARAPQVPST